MATPFQERSPCQTASYPRVRRAFAGKAPCSALSSWRLTTSGSALDNQARRLPSLLLILLMLKVATFSGSLSVLSAESYPPLHKTQGRGTHYVGDVGAIKSPGHPPSPIPSRVRWVGEVMIFLDAEDRKPSNDLNSY